MNHQQWLDWRREGIGSSDAPVIMGVSPWKTRYQLWEEKVFGKTAQKDNPSMARGRELEEIARSKFEKKMNISVFSKNVTHQSVDWMRASLDGIDFDGKVMVEIKCPNKEDHFHALMQKIPSKYFAQCQHQLMVTGLDMMYYFSFDGKDGVIVEVQKDQKYIDSLWIEEHKFWELKTKIIPPELSEDDFMDLNDNPHWNAAVHEWNMCKNSADREEEKLEEVKERLLKICGNKNARGGGVKLTKCVSEGRIDMKRVMQDHPDIPWDSYRKESFQKFMIKNI